MTRATGKKPKYRTITLFGLSHELCECNLGVAGVERSEPPDSWACELAPLDHSHPEL
jgi:hypothetical protein